MMSPRVLRGAEVCIRGVKSAARPHSSQLAQIDIHRIQTQVILCVAHNQGPFTLPALSQTGKRRFYGNILLAKGVVPPEEQA